MLSLEDKMRIEVPCVYSQSNMAVEFQNMQSPAGNAKFAAGSGWRGDNSSCSAMSDAESVMVGSEPSGNSGHHIRLNETEYWFVIIHTLYRNTPKVNSHSPISFDEMLDKSTSTSPRTISPRISGLKHSWGTWRQIIRSGRKLGRTVSRISHLSRNSEYDPVPVDGLIESWDTKARKGASQIKKIKTSHMFGCFGTDVVRM